MTTINRKLGAIVAAAAILAPAAGVASATGSPARPRLQHFYVARVAYHASDDGRGTSTVRSRRSGNSWK